MKSGDSEGQFRWRTGSDLAFSPGSFPRASGNPVPVGSYFRPLGQGPRYFPASFVFIVIACPPSTIFILKNPL